MNNVQKGVFFGTYWFQATYVCIPTTIITQTNN